MKLRRGASLVELLLVMTAGTVMLSLTVALIHRMMNVHSKAQKLADVERTAMRLASQLRWDVHQASAAPTGDSNLNEGTVLQLQLSGGRSVQYERTAGMVLRTLKEGDKVVGHEQFAFPAGIEIDVHQEESNPQLVAVTLTTDLAKSRDLPAYAAKASLHVSAVLGRDTKYQASASQENQP